MERSEGSATLIAVLAITLGNLAVGFLVGWAVYTIALKRSPLQGHSTYPPLFLGPVLDVLLGGDV